MDDPSQASGLTSPAALDAFVAASLPRLKVGLSLLAAPHSVDDAIAEALLELSTRPEHILAMQNPRGYLYRVARNHLRRPGRKQPILPPVDTQRLPEIEPALPAALATLPERQRVAVYLMSGLDWTAREVADVLGIAPTSVHNHHQRGLKRLRKALGEVAQ